MRATTKYLTGRKIHRGTGADQKENRRIQTVLWFVKPSPTLLWIGIHDTLKILTHGKKLL